LRCQAVLQAVLVLQFRKTPGSGPPDALFEP
jgi:hypothetical protein